jgi:hypothetical protein
LSRLVFATLVLLVTACASVKQQADAPIVLENNDTLALVAKHYFELFAQRTQFDAFMALYADNAELQDLVYGKHAVGVAQIKDFYSWEAGEFKMLKPQALVVTEQIISNKVVVTRGYFTQFEYYGQITGPWKFIIWQQFNENNQITQQYDWINYTPKETYIGGDNMNLLIEQ